MKKMLISTVFLGLMAQAHASEKGLSRKFFKCLRSTVHDSRMDDEAIRESINLVNFLAERPQDGEIALLRCKKNRQTFKIENPEFSDEEMSKSLSSMADLKSSKGYEIMEAMINPGLSCHLHGAKADVSIFAGIGVGVAAGQCTGDDGRQWLVVAPTLGLDVGYGVSVINHSMSFYLEEGKRTFYDHGGITAIIAAKYEGAQSEGRGLGIGLMYSAGVTINLKLMPIGNDFDELRKVLKAKSEE